MTAQPRPIAASPTDEDLNEVVKLMHEWGHLKRLPRTGWLRAGIEHPESIAEHSLRTAMLAWMLAGLEGADPERTATLALLHDTGESRTTDIEYVGRHYLHATANEQIAADRTAMLPQPLGQMLRGLIAEFEGRTSLEAECARDADKLEMLLQALDYRQQGRNNMQPFIQSAVKSLRTESGRQLGEAAMRVDPSVWWEAFERVVVATERPDSTNTNSRTGDADRANGQLSQTCSDTISSCFT